MSTDEKDLLSDFRRWSVRGIKLGAVIFVVLAILILNYEASLSSWNWVDLFVACIFCGWLEQMMYGWSLGPPTHRKPKRRK
jgi:hypothetical protein